MSATTRLLANDKASYGSNLTIEQQDNNFKTSSDETLDSTFQHKLSKTNTMAPKPPRNLMLAIFLVAFGLAFPFGWNIGVINLTEAMFKQFVNNSNYYEHGVYLSKGELETLWSFIVSSFVLGGAVGGVSCPLFSEKYGRKGCVISAAVIMIIACVLQAVAHPVFSWEVFTLGRTIAGLASGFGSSLLCIFLSEISPRELRGFSGGFQEVFIVLGKVGAQVLSLPYILGNDFYWPYLVSVPILPSLIVIIILPFLCETPKHIRAKLHSKNLHKSIEFYHGHKENVNKVIAEIDEELEIVTKSLSLQQILSSKIFKNCLILAVVVRLAQEMTGITAIFNFSTSIFVTVGFSTEFAQYNSIGLGAMSAVVTIAAVFLVEHWGRRPILLYGLIGDLICDILFMAFALVVSYTGQHWAAYVCLVILYCHVFIFSTGPGPVGWLIVPEFVPHVGRSGVTSVGVFVNWSSNLLVTMAFLPLKFTIGYWCFLILIIPLALCALYLGIKLPETRNRKVDDIARSLAGGVQPGGETDLEQIEKY